MNKEEKELFKQYFKMLFPTFIILIVSTYTCYILIHPLNPVIYWIAILLIGFILGNYLGYRIKESDNKIKKN